MKDIKFRAYSKQMDCFLDITCFEVYKNEINGVFHDGDFIGYDKEDVSIMQYTGLKDKTGKEIYEGDIVANFNFKDCIFRSSVIYRNGSFGYTSPYWGFVSFQENENFNWIDGKSEHIEVIGNICENSELLEE
jgi:uncharacterized phage protein (TIGR01671 family)